jgi:hypothetical protein
LLVSNTVLSLFFHFKVQQKRSPKMSGEKKKGVGVFFWWRIFATWRQKKKRAGESNKGAF